MKSTGALTRKAFTLIEVLVVTGVIALLAAILVPSLSLARSHAERLRCANNLKMFGDALNVYKGDLGRYPEIGDRDPSIIYGTIMRPGPPAPRWALANIGDVAQALMGRFLKRPDAFFCPASLSWDKRAPTPATIKGGDISYFYLAGLQSTMTFDDNGQPTFDPFSEAPDVMVGNTRHLNRVARVVLTGDRTVEFQPGVKNVPGSNHQRTGGWFMYTSGDILWRGWSLLARHPDPKTYYWYWPRLSPRSR